MDGAGSVIAANYMYNKAEKDGLTLGIWNSHNVFNHMMGDRSLRIDGRKFGWIGSPSKDSVACAIMGFAGLKTFDEILKSKKAVRMGATRAGNTTQLPEMLNRWAGANFEVIPGYTGTSKIRLAMRSREVDGACWTWDSMRSTAHAMLDAKGDDKMIPFIINGKWADPEVKDVAQFHDVIKYRHDLNAFDTWNAANEFARAFSLPPGHRLQLSASYAKPSRPRWKTRTTKRMRRNPSLRLTTFPARKSSDTSNRFIRSRRM